ncbi:MAG: hypothetical protein IJZ77_04625 [Bacilli bacterium]|nr:hypothetical protein [Bacilli bacterium]
MDIVKNEYISDLLGIYGKLLTDYQLEIMELYYYEDLSLSEIALNKDVSRNAIFTLIKRVEKILVDYENKMKLNEKIKKIENRIIDKNLKEDILNILLEGE